MLLEGKALAAELRKTPTDGLTIVPQPDIEALETSGAASIDLRLGRWFTTMRSSRVSILEISDAQKAPASESKITKQNYVPFDKAFVLHPRCFVLGATLEWIRIPPGLGAFVGGKSSWGRRGLIIETAASIHPGFSGCLTLEMTNLGEVPIEIVPGMPICQVVLHRTTDAAVANKSSFDGKRKPTLGRIQADSILEKLRRPLS